MSPSIDLDRLSEIAGRFIAEGATPEEADRRAHAVIRADALNPRALEDIRKLELIREWILAGLFTPGVAILAAKKGNWKSLFSLQAAYAIAAGAPFLGREVEHSRVLYLALELDELAMSERAQKIGPAPDGLDVLTSIGRGDDALEDVEALLLARGYRLVVVDMLSAILPAGTDGNHYDEVTPWMLRLRRLAQQYHACILCLMHSPKSTRDDFADAVLGSTGFAGQADSIIVLDRKRGEDTANLYSTGNHGRDQAFRIRIDGDLRLHLDGEIPVAKDTADREAVLAALSRNGANGASAAMIGTATGKSEDAARKMLQRLAADGKAERIRRGLYVVRGAVPPLEPVAPEDSPF